MFTDDTAAAEEDPPSLPLGRLLHKRAQMTALWQVCHDVMLKLDVCPGSLKRPRSHALTLLQS